MLVKKELTKTDVDVRLSFPMKSLKAFEFPRGKDKVEFEAIDSTGKSWIFGLSRRNSHRHSHPKPVLSSGWRAYVQAKGLKQNDRVIIHYEERDKAMKTRFKIRAQRKSPKTLKLFGKEVEIWDDLENLQPEVAA